jgi:HAE1 family hydrophobic/amphiphilic exporter-1
VNDVGSTEITLQFNPSRNIDAAAQDVQAAIAHTLPQLPLGVPIPPSYRKFIAPTYRSFIYFQP